jgi:hypothetical protein
MPLATLMEVAFVASSFEEPLLVFAGEKAESDGNGGESEDLPRTR